LETMVDGECEDVKQLMCNLNVDYHARRFRHYTGHQARLAHEQEAMDTIKEELKLKKKSWRNISMMQSIATMI
jgi:hypothetical protein